MAVKQLSIPFYQKPGIGRARHFCSRERLTQSTKAALSTARRVILDTPRECRHCSGTFVPQNRRGSPPEHCSAECKQLANVFRVTPRMTKPCANCGAEFVGTRGKQYCSQKCRTVKRKHVNVCEVCQETFRSANGGRRFCSAVCYGKHCSETRRPIRELPICQNAACGKQYVPKASNRLTYCSKKCSAIASGRRRSAAKAARLARLAEEEARQLAESLAREAERRGRNRRPCAACFTPFVALDAEQRYCSVACCPNGVTHCRLCGIEFAREAGSGRPRLYCSHRCTMRAVSLRNVERRRDAARDGEDISNLAVFERDQWTCWICERPVDRLAKAPAHLAPALDHKVPIVKGGPHTMDNVACTHWICNTIKKDRPIEAIRDKAIRAVLLCLERREKRGKGQVA